MASAQPRSFGPGSGAKPTGQSVDEITAQIQDLLAGVQEQQARTNDKTVLEFKGQWHPKPNGAATGHGVVPKTWELAKASENDRALATFGWAGGAALCLSNAFSEADAIEAQVEDLLDHGHSEDHPTVQCLRTVARASEEREAVMRKQWSDIDFQEGEESNQEVLNHLERDFATQVAQVAAKQRAQDADFLGHTDGATGSSPPRPWFNIKVFGGTAVGKVYLSANIQKQDGRDIGLQGYDDGSGRQRWLIEEGQSGDWFHLRLVGGTSSERRLLAVSPSGSEKLLELSAEDDSSGRQRWRLVGSQRSSAATSKLTWYSIQPFGSNGFLAGDGTGGVFLEKTDAGSGRERWLIPQWPGVAEGPSPGAQSPATSSTSSQRHPRRDEILTIVERCSAEGAPTLADLSLEEMTRVLNNNRNLGAAIDLVGCYLKNYEIDKADRVCQRIEPLCRERGGLWLFKLLNFYSTVRMKQSRYQEALAMYEEYEQLIGMCPDEQWELFDTVFRNFGWIHCSLGNHEKALYYFRRCVEVKKKNGVPPHWFDQWDLGKTHARLSVQKGNFAALSHSLELIKKGIELHQQVEEQDKVMLCKMLNSGGECASLLGDYGESATQAQAWHEEAVRLHRRSYEIYVAVLGVGKPLTGWCMEHLAGALRRLGTAESRTEAKDLLVAAFRVESSKDIIKLSSMERLLGSVLDAHSEAGDLAGLVACQGAINTGLENLRRRRVNESEAVSYAALLRRIAQVLLAQSSSENIVCATALLEEATVYAERALSDPAVSKQREVARLLELLQGQSRAREGGAAEAWAASREAPVFGGGPKAGGQEISDIDARELLGDLRQQLRGLRERRQEEAGVAGFDAAGRAPPASSTTSSETAAPRRDARDAAAQQRPEAQEGHLEPPHPELQPRPQRRPPEAVSAAEAAASSPDRPSPRASAPLSAPPSSEEFWEVVD